jgi:hypothetical protein
MDGTKSLRHTFMAGSQMIRYLPDMRDVAVFPKIELLMA